MITALSIAVAAMALGWGFTAIRMAGIVEERDRARRSFRIAEDNAIAVSTELSRHRKATMAQMDDLREDIERLEHDLGNCTTPGARRERLRRLLSKAKTPKTDPS